MEGVRWSRKCDRLFKITASHLQFVTCERFSPNVLTKRKSSALSLIVEKQDNQLFTDQRTYHINIMEGGEGGGDSILFVKYFVN